MTAKNKILFLWCGLLLTLVSVSCKAQDFPEDSPAQISSKIIPTNVDIYKYYPSRKINKSDNPFIIPEKSTNKKLFQKISIVVNGNKISLDKYLKNSETTAILVLYNDTLRYEDYFESNGEHFDSASIFTSFSVSKSFVSVLFGIALQEKAINSIDDPVINYIPELKNIKGIENIKLYHLLQMTSGIAFNEDAGTSSDLMNLYQVNDVFDYLNHIRLSENPGTQFYYKSIDTQLLGIVISRAVKKSLSAYLQEKIWFPAGMQYEASWSIDKMGGTERAYGCLNARAIDFAKFGQMILHKGFFNGKQIVDSTYVNSLYIKNSINEPSSFYKYQWWQIGIPVIKHKREIVALGILGQFIYINPESKVVIVKFSNKKTDYLSDYIMLRALSDFFNK